MKPFISPEIVDRFWPTGWASSHVRPHDVADQDHMVDLGVNEMGDLIEVNDCLVESDLVIYMSGWSGVPAVLGGYLGGGQGITVGLGSARSIMTHHAYRIHEHKDSMASEARKQLFMFNLANRIIFCGPKSAEAASIVGGDGCPDLGRRVASGVPDCRQQ